MHQAAGTGARLTRGLVRQTKAGSDVTVSLLRCDTTLIEFDNGGLVPFKFVFLADLGGLRLRRCQRLVLIRLVEELVCLNLAHLGDTC